jgi:inorganic pyrophosphatase/exopolyphosphatase
MVMAPIRKNRVEAVSPKLIWIFSLTCASTLSPDIYDSGDIMNKVQHTTHISKAIAALLISNILSVAIHA